MKFEEKHRPKTLDDIIFVDAYVERIVKETAANKRHKNLILHGPRGAGCQRHGRRPRLLGLSRSAAPEG